MRHNEKGLYKPLIRGARIEGWLLFRLSDTSIDKKPFDISGTTSSGVAVGLEVKTIDNALTEHTVFPWSKFEDHQIQWLKAYAEKRAYSLACIQFLGSSNILLFRLSPNHFVKGILVKEIPSYELKFDNLYRLIGWMKLK